MSKESLLKAAAANGGVCGEVSSERWRQVAEEGFTAEHDDQHAVGVLADAGASYALQAVYRLYNPKIEDAHPPGKPPFGWPWGKEWWKPGAPRRSLIKAAALIIAEIERLDREAARESVAG